MAADGPLGLASRLNAFIEIFRVKPHGANRPTFPAADTGAAFSGNGPAARLPTGEQGEYGVGGFNYGLIQIHHGAAQKGRACGNAFGVVNETSTFGK
jgi:hypothetical protein